MRRGARGRLVGTVGWVVPAVLPAVLPAGLHAGLHAALCCGSSVQALCPHKPTAAPAVFTPQSPPHCPASLPSCKLLMRLPLLPLLPRLLQRSPRREMPCCSTASNPMAPWTAPPCTPAAPSSGASSGQVGSCVGGWEAKRGGGGLGRQAGSWCEIPQCSAASNDSSAPVDC